MYVSPMVQYAQSQKVIHLKLASDWKRMDLKWRVRLEFGSHLLPWELCQKLGDLAEVKARLQRLALEEVRHNRNISCMQLAHLVLSASLYGGAPALIVTCTTGSHTDTLSHDSLKPA